MDCRYLADGNEQIDEIIRRLAEMLVQLDQREMLVVALEIDQALNALKQTSSSFDATV